jgi:flavin-dependent dehydrogenase
MDMYDVIMVGARVAGSSAAMLLARRGVRVLVLDRATFPSDTLSTHQVQVPAVGRLAKWGVLQPLLDAGTPQTRTIRFQQGDTVIHGHMPTVDGIDAMISPRRTLLDAVLVDAARTAGAEVREDFTVAELLVEGGRVAGVRGRVKGGATVTERAPLVVGADGRRSMVARTVGAPEYRCRPAQTVAYYTYWAGVPVNGGEIYGWPRRAVGLWPTDDGLVMSYLAWPVAEFAEFRRDVEGNVLATLDAAGVGERFRAGRRVERFRGSPDLPGYFRRPYGDGWALLGDAGLAMDPITGQGISDAFRDAELLADAVVDGGVGKPYQKSRDRAVRPMYDFTARLAALNPPGPGERDLFAALAANPEAANGFFAALTGAVPLSRFMSPANIVRLIGVRGFLRLAAGSRRSASSRPVSGQ